MDTTLQSILNRRRLLSAAIGLGVGFPVTLGYAATVARQASASRVIALGAGDDLSVLVTAGRARLLIATGTDTTAFGNALGSVLPLGIRRIDVVLLAGGGRSSTVAAYAARSVGGRSYTVIDPTLRIEDLDAPPNFQIEVLAGPRRFQMPDDISVTVETTPRTDGNPASPGWRAMVERGLTRVLIVPDGRVSTHFPPTAPIAALVVTSGHPVEALADTRAPSVTMSAGSASLETLRDDLSPTDASRLYAIEVFAGGAKSLSFVDGGLRLPSDATVISTSGLTE